MRKFLVALGVATCAAALGPTAARAADDKAPPKPTYTDRFNAGTDEVEYVLEKVARSGREVTLTFSATLTKGPEKRTMLFFGVNAVDADGKEHKARIGAQPNGKSQPLSVDLRAGIKTRVEVRFPLAEGVTKLQAVEVTASAVERVAIKLADIDVPKK